MNSGEVVKRPPNALVSFYYTSKGYCHCDRLPIPRLRLLNLPEKQRTTHRRRRVGPALIGHAGKHAVYYFYRKCSNDWIFRVLFFFQSSFIRIDLIQIYKVKNMLDRTLFLCSFW